MILTTLPATNVRTARRGDGGLHPGTASQLTLSVGSGQTAVAGTNVPVAPAVVVRDQLDQPIAGFPVQFVVVGGSSVSEVTVDTFARANENPLAGTWSKVGGAATNLQLFTNSLRGATLNGEGLMYSTAATWPADQYSECQLLVGDPGGGGPAVRMLAGADSVYMAQAIVGQVTLFKIVSGTYTVLQQVATALGSTDTLRLEARGSTLRMYKNGLQLGTDVIDGSLTTGAPGLDIFSNTTFTVTRWAAGLPPSTSGTVNPDTTVLTNAAGVAAATAWTLGTVPGVNTLTVTSAGLAGSAVTVTATGVTSGAQATQIASNAGNNQTAQVGTALPVSPSVIVRDAANQPVAGVLVTFAIASGAGTLIGANQTTNASGIATVGSWTLGSAIGTNTLTATSAGLSGSPVTFTATGTGVLNELLFEELFTGTTQAYYEGRGWYDGTAYITAGAGDGYKFLTDATLGRNVLYAHWATITPTFGDPKEPAIGIRLPLTTTGLGATAYLLFKTHNMMGAATGCHWTRFGRGWGTFTPTNSAGQIDMDLVAQGPQNLLHDPATGLVINDTSGVFRTFYLAIGDSTTWANPAGGGLLTDDTWYEMAYYVKPSSGSGTSDGIVRVVVRPYGGVTWTTVFVGTNVATALGTGTINQFVIALYGGTTGAGVRWTNDIRTYFATIRVFSGDAITSGAALPLGSLRAFPFAQGYKVDSTLTGGRSLGAGEVRKVTNLNDSGAGSLRQALATPGPADVVFEVAGQIPLASRLVVGSFLTDMNITVWGETAPAPGITIINQDATHPPQTDAGLFVIKGQNVVLRHLRWRLTADKNDAVFVTCAVESGNRVTGSHKLLYANCSMAYNGADENAGMAEDGTADITYYRCIIGPGSGAQCKGMLLTGYSTALSAKNIALIQNFWPLNFNRNPEWHSGAEFVMYNNYLYGGGNPIGTDTSCFAGFFSFGAGVSPFPPVRVSLRGNRYEGCATDNRPQFEFDQGLTDATPDHESYFDDNLNVTRCVQSPTVVVAKSAETDLTMTLPEVGPALVLPSATIKTYVLARAGARPLDRDTVDTLSVTNANAGTGAPNLSAPPAYSLGTGSATFNIPADWNAQAPGEATGWRVLDKYIYQNYTLLVETI